MPFLTPLPCFWNLLLIGIDTWVRLHATMLVMLTKFNCIAMAYYKKFKTIFNAYKEDKMTSDILGNNWQKRKFYDALDKWYHQAGQVTL